MSQVSTPCIIIFSKGNEAPSIDANKTKKRHVVSFFIVPLTRFTYIGAKIAYQQVYSAVNRQMRFSNHVLLKRCIHTQE
jgi:hypothetical protein